MANDRPLGPEQLAAVLRQLDQVEAEAHRLREQITRAMRQRRASERTLGNDTTLQGGSSKKR
jgi:hypothetical protein